VHALPSLHGDPFAFAGVEQYPVEGLQVPAVWQSSIATHTTGLLPVQLPPEHASVRVHPLLSLQAVPSDAVGLLHTPVLGLQVPARWQASRAVQVTGVPTVQEPELQLSPMVHPFPSLQAVPFAAGGFVHVPVAVSQVPGT